MSEKTKYDVADEFADNIDLEAGTGAEAAEEASEERGGGGFGRRWVWLDQLIKGDEASKAQEKDRVYLRYLTDYEANPENGVGAWITANVHTAVPTKPKPASEDKDRTWPKAMSCVCRKSKIIEKATGGKCWVCDNVKDKYKPEKPHSNPPKTFAVAVLREPIIGDGSEEMGGPRKKGRKIGFTDVTVEVPVFDEDGEIVKEGDTVVTEVVPQYVIVRQAYRNYYQSLRSAATAYGTALDRDWLVVRNGDDKDTSYDNVAMDPMKIEIDGEQIDFDMSDPDLREVYYPDMPHLSRIITDQATMDYYNKWFIPQEGDDEAGGSTDAKRPAARSSEPDADHAAKMKERLRARQAAKKEKQDA